MPIHFIFEIDTQGVLTLIVVVSKEIKMRINGELKLET